MAVSTRSFGVQARLGSRSRLSCRLAFRSAAPRSRAAATVPRAEAPTTSPSKPSATAAPGDYLEDKEFNISKVSFGAILAPTGCALLLYGFGAYFNLLPGSDVSPIMLVYGFPAAVLGFALNYAQLDPVPCKTAKAALALRETQMTDIQKQIREDCTRFRYGDEQHLEEALDKVFKFNKPKGIPKRFAPVLRGLREEVVEGKYTLVMEFESKLELEKWEPFQPKLQSFFGPGIVAQLQPVATGMDVLLISDGSGAGRGGGDKKDVLPPLLPGLKPRQQ